MVLLNGPVQNALFCLLDRYGNVCVWFMARSSPFPMVGTYGCQRGNQRLPLQELPVPQGWNCCQRGNDRLHLCKEMPVPRPWNLRLPTWEPEVTIARNCLIQEIRISVFRSYWAIILRNCGFPKLETHGSRHEKVTIPMEPFYWLHIVRPHGSFKVLFTEPVEYLFFCWPLDGHKTFLHEKGACQNGYHDQDLPVSRLWNLRLPTWEPEVTTARNFLIQAIRISVFEATGQSF